MTGRDYLSIGIAAVGNVVLVDVPSVGSVVLVLLFVAMSVAKWANTLSEPQYLLAITGCRPALAWVHIPVGA